jgi:lysophospholipase L1-like esterase
MTVHRTRGLAAGLATLLATLGATAPAAHAGPRTGPTAVVTMGDSYISGEAGRWAGNSADATPGNDGTDRACVPAGAACQVDKSRVYVDGTDADGCHRSDVSEVRSARLPVADRINIACSGAVTSNLLTAAEGGTGQNGEPAQGDQLATVARSHDVRAIVVSIGGNDLGFAGIIARCLEAYEARTGPCAPTEQPKLAAAIPAATAKVERVVDSIRGVMSAAGYAGSDYRLVLQTYPSVAARAAENRYGEADPRRTADGCANYDADLDWARDQASAEIDGMVAAAARGRATELLDLHDLFQGHEVCAKTDAEATPLSRPAPAGSEWGRFVGAGTIQQGDLQEAFHPNAYGQQAFGACLGALYATSGLGEFACSSSAGRAPAAVTFTRTAHITPSSTSAPRGSRGSRPGLRLHFRRHYGHGRRHGRRRVCIAFSVRGAGHPVRRATVRFAGHRGRSGRHGRVRICGRPAPGRHRATARHTGFRAVHRSIRIRR